MLQEVDKKKYKRLRHEVIDLFQCAHSYVNKHNSFYENMGKISRIKWMEEFMSLRYLERGILLHLTNLDDKSASYSFVGIKKIINKNNDIEISKKQELNKQISEYRNLLQGAKTKTIRNTILAHMNLDHTPTYFESLNDYNKTLKPLLIKAGGIADLIWGEFIEVRLKAGSYEGIIDFRRDVMNLKMEL